MRRLALAAVLALTTFTGVAATPAVAADPPATPFTVLPAFGLPPSASYDVAVDPVGGAWVTTPGSSWLHYGTGFATSQVVDVSALGESRTCNPTADPLGRIVCSIPGRSIVTVDRGGGTTVLGSYPATQRLFNAPTGDGGTGVWYFSETDKGNGVFAHELVHRDASFAQIETRDVQSFSPDIRVTPDGAVWITRNGGYVGRSTAAGLQWVRPVIVGDNEYPGAVIPLADSSVLLRVSQDGWTRIAPNMSMTTSSRPMPLWVDWRTFGPDGTIWGADRSSNPPRLYVSRPGHSGFSVPVPDGSGNIVPATGSDGTVVLDAGDHLVLVDSSRPFSATTLTRTGNQLVGEPQTLTATVVTEDGSAPHGTVTFIHEGATIATVPVGPGGVAQTSWTLPENGPDLSIFLTASFVSDGATVGSTSPVLTAFGFVEQVTAPSQTFSPNPTVPGPITISEQLQGDAGVVPRGQVRLTFDGDPTFAQTVPVAADGRATFAVTFFAGDYVARFQYLPASAGFHAATWSTGLHVGYDDAASKFVNRIFEDLLGRPSTAGEVDSWRSRVGSVGARAAFALAVTATDEFRSDLLAAQYRRVLGRSPDAGGLAYWVGRMRGGLRLEDVLVNMIASDEYFAANGNDPGRYLDQVYDDVLRRAPDTLGREYWLGRLGAHPSAGVRSQVVAGIIMSDESLFPIVDSYYQFLLGRHSDAAGLRYWVSRIQHGSRDEEVIGLICGSTEYYSIALALPLQNGPVEPVDRAPRPWAAP